MKMLWLVALVCCLGCCASSSQETQQVYAEKMCRYMQASRLPTGVTDVEWHGNGWVTFKWHEMKFLYQFQGQNGGHSAITRID